MFSNGEKDPNTTHKDFLNTIWAYLLLKPIFEVKRLTTEINFQAPSW